MRTKRVLSILGVFFLAGLVIMSWSVWSLFRAVRSAASGPTITISKETTFIDGPLDEDGNVDYVAALNQLSSEGVTPDNNAVVLFWQAFGPGRPSERIADRFFEMIGMERPPKDGQYLIGEEDYRLKEWLAAEANAGSESARAAEDGLTADEIREQLARAARSPWTLEECPAVAELLKTNDAALKIIIEGTRRPRYYAPMVAIEDQRTIIEIFLPTRNRCREAAHFLLARAMFRLGEGKTDEAWQDLLACHRMARLVAQGPLIVDGLVGAGIEGMALSGDAIVAASGKLSAQQAKRFLAKLEALGPMPKMVDKIISGARYVDLDALMALPAMISDEVEDEPFILSGKLERSMSKAASGIAMDWDELLRTYNTWYDRLVEAALKPTRAERLSAVEQLDSELDKVCNEGEKFSSLVQSVIAERSVRTVVAQKIGPILFALLQPSVTAALDSGDRVKSQFDIARIAFALAAYHAEHGEYPENLADLSPDYLAEIPKDLFAESDFRYARNDAGYLLYGVGQNGKDEEGKDFGSDYGHLEQDQIPEDADHDTDDIAIRVPAERL